jgi:hypothetical protein
MLRTLALAAALAVALIPPAFAEEEEEIIVTGSRLEIYRNYAVPHVNIVRRADFAVVETTLRNDTRSADARRAEMIEALQRMESRAGRSGMSLALVDDDIDIVRQYTQAAAEQLMRGEYNRADSSILTIRVRTRVTASDTLETIRARVEGFVNDLPKPGRVEITVGDTDLSMVDLEQYRAGMLQDILAESRSLAGRLGAAQSVQIGGLEGQVAFQRTSDLDLVLFLPYTVSVQLSAVP